MCRVGPIGRPVADDPSPRLAVDLNSVRSAHLVGIAGAAMTPLATILLQKGVSVTGSDLVDAAHLDLLRRLGATIWIGHDGERLGSPEVVVVSSAIIETNPEVRAAQTRRIPVVKHAEALASLMHARRGIAVAGTHGKSTTSALVAHVLEIGGLSPTFHVGAELVDYGAFGRLGTGEYLVAEADEFDRRFLAYDPEVAVVTHVEADHLDYFGTFAAVAEAFQDFVDRVRPHGSIVVNADDPVASALAHGSTTRITYGTVDGADWRIAAWQPLGLEGSRLTLRSPDGMSHDFELALLGRHNALNAAAATAVATQAGVDVRTVRAGLATFHGIRRRMERLGVFGGVCVVDDYAHHPTEVRATLAAVRAHWNEAHGQSGQLWAVYQPHTEHRTGSLLTEFARCFGDANHVFLTSAYVPEGRVLATGGVTAAQLAASMSHPDVRYLDRDEAISRMAAEAQPGDVVVVMGAGDIWTIEAPLIAALEGRAS